MGKKHCNKNKAAEIILAAAFVCMMAAAAYSGRKLYRYYADYSKDRQRYEDLRENVIFAWTEEEDISVEEETAVSKTDTEKRPGREVESAKEAAPLAVDWEKLKEINADIIGWVYFTGLPQISYPILQAEDNSYYVNRTYDLSSDSSKAGSIFMDYRMNEDFSSPYSVIYGHNVRDGSMLSDLALLKDQELYDREPYFWILTPDGKYQYEIFSIFQCHRSADVFQKQFDVWGEEFREWEQELKARNVMEGDVQLGEYDHVVAFATCVPNSYDRTIVCGRCRSDEQPPYREGQED